MRNHLLTTVAAAALSLSVVGAFAQDAQRRPDSNNPPGASSESPRGAQSRSDSEKAAPAQRASEGAARPSTEKSSAQREHENDRAKQQPSNAAQTKTGASEEQNKGSRQNASEASKDSPKPASTAAERNSSDKGDAAQSASDKGATSAQKNESDMNKAGSSGGRSTATETGKPSSERQGASAPASSDRNQMNRDSAQGTAPKSTSGRDDAASTRTGADANRAASRTESSSSNIQVRGDLDTDRGHASRVHDRLIRESGARETDVSISVDLGGRVPDRVRLRPVPADIVEISPRFRNYEYTIVRDEIVIVEPKTKKIVQIIGGGGNSGRGARHTINLDTHQRDIVRRDVLKTHTSKRAPDTNFELREGAEVPDRVTLESFPTQVWEEVPTLKEYRYVVIEDQVVLVDPQTREVVEVIH